MSSAFHLAAAGLVALTLAACATAPAAPGPEPVPPPQRPYDAKTQLEYGERLPPGPRR